MGSLLGYSPYLMSCCSATARTRKQVVGHDSVNIQCMIILIIKKTRLYNFDPLKPHFYIVNLGFTGVHIIFLISAQNIDCGYSLEPPRRGGYNEYPQFMFLADT